MSTTDANPYASPAAAGRRRPRGPRLPLGKLLLGLPIVPPGVVAAHVALWPVGIAAEYVANQFLLGSVWVSAGPDAASIVDQLLSMLIFGAINAFAFGLPMVLVGWKTRSIRPRRVLWCGAFAALLWWVAMTAIATYALLSEPPTLLSDPQLVVYQRSRLVEIVQLAMMFLLFGPLPLFAGAAAYAWWVRRLMQRHGAVSSKA